MSAWACYFSFDMMTEERNADLLRKHGLKATAARLELLKVLQKQNSAMHLNDIQKGLKDQDRVTVYRNLNSLIENGLIHIAFQNTRDVYYALCPAPCESGQHIHQHLHFHCTQCGKVECLPFDFQLKLPSDGYKVKAWDLRLEGQCDQCP
jgi:Fur family ferric uptake transcriptional regulator